MAPWIKVHSYKHDGSLHRCWERNFLLEETDSYFITASKQTRVIEYDGRCWFSKEPAVAFFSKKDWFNLIAMIKEEGIILYINLASPTLKEGEILRYIDYDLDYKLYPDGSFITLDEKEFEHHKKKYLYHEDLLNVLAFAETKIKKLVNSRQFPFQIEEISKFYQMFLDKTSE